MAEETVCGLCVHASASCIGLDFCLADLAYLRISGLRVHEDEAAYAGLRDHGIAFGQLDAEAELSGKHVDDVSLECVVRAA